MIAINDQGGGNAQPNYLQARVPRPITTPVIRPASQVAPNESKASGGAVSGNSKIAPKSGGMFGGAINSILAKTPQQSTIAGGTQLTPAGGKPVPQTLYDFFKQDLEDQRRSALADTTSNAAARGVYYGSPLTTSQGDIQTQYLRGLGQLQSGILQNEQQNELSRLGIAGNLLNSAPQVQGGGLDPAVYQMLGQLFGSSSVAGGSRSGPTITPKKQRTGDRISNQPTVN